MKIKLIVEKLPPKGCHLFFKGKINGVSTRFLIDTGASKSVIGKHFIDNKLHHIQIEETEHQTTGLGATFEKSEFALLRRIKLGKMQIKSSKFAIINLNVINTAYEAVDKKIIDAIIGGDILLKYGAIIDYTKFELELFEPK